MIAFVGRREEVYTMSSGTVGHSATHTATHTAAHTATTLQHTLQRTLHQHCNTLYKCTRCQVALKYGTQCERQGERERERGQRGRGWGRRRVPSV